VGALPGKPGERLIPFGNDFLDLAREIREGSLDKINVFAEFVTAALEFSERTTKTEIICEKICDDGLIEAVPHFVVKYMAIGPKPAVLALKRKRSSRLNSLRGNRFVAIAAISGALLLFVGTAFHPMQADPNRPLGAFSEYAADRHWVASHLTQLAGVALMVAALVTLSRKMADGPADWLATLAAAGAIASIATAAVLQAVDGVALKAMVNAWAAAPVQEKDALFQAAFAVRQIEIGLASITSLLFGVTAALYGSALLTDPRFPKWLGLSALLGGVPTAIAGVVIAYTGFSGLAMDINLWSSSLLLSWMVALGISVWSQSAPRG